MGKKQHCTFKFPTSHIKNTFQVSTVNMVQAISLIKPIKKLGNGKENNIFKNWKIKHAPFLVDISNSWL